ncbi:protein amalgam isoform X2 [Lepeophtheirus salmonis]|uniref:protein amalgam isoform X2 n=1 Tax=Lepeophtheirus salmonis TaxID=72036 RepID=UPI001AE6CE50|nr:protein amalgam-like isoform X2 [Lepeophtheirus salmonis]
MDIIILFIGGLISLWSYGLQLSNGVEMFPIFTEPLGDQIARVGQNVTFTCKVKHIKAYKVGWVKADTKAIQAIFNHVITHNSRISVTHKNRQEWNLHITGVTLEDAGPYMCQLNTDPMIYQKGELTVYVPPDIVEVRGDHDVVEGGVAKLSCEAAGYPRPKIYWRRENVGDKIIVWDRKSGQKREVDRVEGKTLQLFKVKRSQMGNYMCIANNGYTPAISRLVRLAVNFRPVISVREQKIYARIGDDVQCDCVIEAYPRGIRYWELGTGEMITEKNSKYLIREIKLSEYTIKTQLTVRNFSNSDEGAYKCVSKNAMTNADDRVEGIVFVNREIIETTTAFRFYNTYTHYSDFDNYNDMMSTAYYNPYYRENYHGLKEEKDSYPSEDSNSTPSSFSSSNNNHNYDKNKEQTSWINLLICLLFSLTLNQDP